MDKLAGQGGKKKTDFRLRGGLPSHAAIAEMRKWDGRCEALGGKSNNLSEQRTTKKKGGSSKGTRKNVWGGEVSTLTGRAHGRYIAKV